MRMYAIYDRLRGSFNPPFPSDNDLCVCRDIASNVLKAPKIAIQDKEVWFLFEVDEKTGLVISKPEDKKLIKTCLDILADFSEDSKDVKSN